MSEDRRYDAEADEDGGVIEHITQFLVELGRGFSYVGKEYQLVAGGSGQASRNGIPA